MNIMDMLSGELVKRREAMPQESLGSLMGMLSQGAHAPALPAMSNQGSGLGSAVLKQFVANKMAKSAAEDQAKLKTEEDKPGIDYARNAPQSYTNPDTGVTEPLSPFDQARYWQASPDEASRKMGNSMMAETLKDKDPKNFQFQDIGVEGSPNLIQKVRVNQDGSYTPFGVPRTQGAGVQVNVGDKLPPASSGYMWNKDATAQTFIPGGPADPNLKQPTQAEDTATKFGTGMVNASNRINESLKKYNIEKSSPTDRAARVLGDGFGDVGSQISNAIKSPTRRKLDQSTSEFRQFALTAMTGAAYSQDQKDDAMRAMIPTDDDDEETQAIKNQARDDFTRSMIQSGLPIGKRSSPDKAPEGWNDQIEAEYQQYQKSSGGK
jgi:hypothetical protein